MLRVQEVNLRAEMNDKLAQKDQELKKMIAELEQKMLSRTSALPEKRQEDSGFGRPDYYRDSQFEADSDFSIDSDDI